jgi:hypothetical protein
VVSHATKPGRSKKSSDASLFEEERPATLLDAVVAIPSFLSSNKRRGTDLDRLYNHLFFFEGKKY